MTAEPLSGRGPNPAFEQQMLEAAAEKTRTDLALKAQIEALQAQRTANTADYERLEVEWKAYTAEVYGEQRALTAPIDHPDTHELVVGYLRADETRVVHVEDWTHPQTRRQMPGLNRFLTPVAIAGLCNAPKVSVSKFDKALEAGTVSMDVAAQVCEVKTKSAYIALAKPDAAPS